MFHQQLLICCEEVTIIIFYNKKLYIYKLADQLIYFVFDFNESLLNSLQIERRAAHNVYREVARC